MSTTRVAVLSAAIVAAIATAACDREGDRPEDAPATTPAPSGGEPGTAAPPPAAPGGGFSPPTTGPVAGADRSFLDAAATDGLAEVEAGRIAAERASDPEVKSFGETLQQDHLDANGKLQRLASAKELSVPDMPTSEHRSHLDALRAASGEELDRVFLRHFGADAHRKTIALFERQAAEGQDPELRKFAEETLPTLQKHMDTAQKLESRLGGG